MRHPDAPTREQTDAVAQAQVFVMGGSWSGVRGPKRAELYNAGSNSWSVLSGIDPVVMNSGERGFRSDNYGWFFAWRRDSGELRVPPKVTRLHCGQRTS